MILPSVFAKLAARGKATLLLIPAREPHEAKRAGPRGTTRTGTSSTYTSVPWAPQVGRQEPVQERVEHRTDSCPTCNIPMRESDAKGPGWLWCWSCGRYESTSPQLRTVCDITITGHTTMHLASLAVESHQALALVRAAGFKTRHDLADAWMRHHDKDWPPKTEALCPTCNGDALVDGERCTAGCDTAGVILVEDVPAPPVVLERFTARHGNTRIHAVEIHVDRVEHERYLAPAGRPKGDEHGYTRNPSLAVRDAGAVVDARTQEGFVIDARENRRTAASIATVSERQLIERAIRGMEGKTADVRVARELRHMRARLRRITELLAAA